jgi:SAM-dependent methyltransferase
MDFRSTFDDVAELYDASRPRYPDALFAELVRRAELQPDARLLEIAPGTGQATLPLAQRGYRITAVELGASMARVARDRLAAYPNVAVVNASFEAADLPAGTFDLVYVATAFHWITPEVRFAKSHALLKRAGHLAIIYRHHVSDERGDAFTAATQPIYRCYERDMAAGARTYVPRRRDDLRPDLIDEALFTPVSFAAFPQVARYSADQYVDLLGTYSPTLAMPSDARKVFLGDIRRLIDDRFGGQVLQHYAMSLQVARRK